jgi:hypothetical protein
VGRLGCLTKIQFPLDDILGLGAIAAGRLGRVDGRALVGDVSHETIDMVSRVGRRLDATVGQGDDKGALDDAVGVLRLGLLEVGLAVVVVDAVLVGKRLGRELLLRVGGGGAVRGRTRGVGGSQYHASDDKLKTNSRVIKHCFKKRRL